jgi:hypothetical protein
MEWHERAEISPAGLSALDQAPSGLSFIFMKLGENVGVRGIVFHCEQLCANFTNFILAPAHSRDALLR